MSFTIKKNLKKFIFVNKNWPNDCRVGCKSLSNHLELIGINAPLEDWVETIWMSFWKRWNCGFINCWKYIQGLLFCPKKWY
jgi:hypothetical protein